MQADLLADFGGCLDPSPPAPSCALVKHLLVLLLCEGVQFVRASLHVHMLPTSISCLLQTSWQAGAAL